MSMYAATLSCLAKLASHEKTALNRATKEFLKTQTLAHRQAFFGVKIPSKWVRAPVEPAEVGKELRLLSQTSGASPSIRLRRRATQRVQLSSMRHIAVPGFFDAMSRTLASGGHLPKKGETWIPAAITGEIVHGKGSSKYFYRGNPLPTNGNALLSRHPDVASAYAIGNTSGQYTDPDGLVFRFLRKGVPHLGESGSDILIRGTRKMRLAENRILRKEQKRLDLIGAAKAGNHPTYETIVEEGRIPELAEKLNGVFRVRRSRTPDGMPAYALKEIRPTVGPS